MPNSILTIFLKSKGMTQRHDILLVCKREFGPALCDFIAQLDPKARANFASSRAAVETALDEAGGAPVRLITFLTDIIIPEALLIRAGLTGYNIHPGPPTYPGVAPTTFAIWDEATTFGVTAHELAPRVDEGAIVAVNTFPMPLGVSEYDLGDHAFAAALTLFRDIARHCASSASPLPRSGERWSGIKRTYRDLDRLKARFSSLSAGDRDRLLRACADVAPTVTSRNRAA